MTITFYKIADDKRQVSKTLNSTTKIKDSIGVIKTDCSIMEPRIEMAYDSQLITANYMYISDFGRYYFINKIDTGAQRLFIEAYIDVLQTYSAQIKELDCIVARQEAENKSQLYLNDGIWKNLQIKQTVPLAFPKSFDKDGSFVFVTGGQS